MANLPVICATCRLPLVGDARHPTPEHCVAALMRALAQAQRGPTPPASERRAGVPVVIAATCQACGKRFAPQVCASCVADVVAMQPTTAGVKLVSDLVAGKPVTSVLSEIAAQVARGLAGSAAAHERTRRRVSPPGAQDGGVP